MRFKIKLLTKYNLLYKIHQILNKLQKELNLYVRMNVQDYHISYNVLFCIYINCSVSIKNASLNLLHRTRSNAKRWMHERRQLRLEKRLSRSVALVHAEKCAAMRTARSIAYSGHDSIILFTNSARSCREWERRKSDRWLATNQQRSVTGQRIARHHDSVRSFQ